MYGHGLQRAQQSLLPYIPDKARVLVLGGGSGWILQQRLQTGKALTIVCLDASPAMLRRARQAYEQLAEKHCCSVSFRLGNEQALQWQETV